MKHFAGIACGIAVRSVMLFKTFQGNPQNPSSLVKIHGKIRNISTLQGLERFESVDFNNLRAIRPGMSV